MLNGPCFINQQEKTTEITKISRYRTEHSEVTVTHLHIITFMKDFTHLEACFTYRWETTLGTTVGWKLYHESWVQKVGNLEISTNQPNKHFTHLSLSLYDLHIYVLYTLAIRVVCLVCLSTPQIYLFIQPMQKCYISGRFRHMDGLSWSF